MVASIMYLFMGGFICLVGMTTKGKLSSFFETFGRNMTTVMLVGVGILSVFSPNVSLWVLSWFGFNLLSPVLKGPAYVVSVTCELIFFVYCLIPVIGIA